MLFKTLIMLSLFVIIPLEAYTVIVINDSFQDKSIKLIYQSKHQRDAYLPAKTSVQLDHVEEVVRVEVFHSVSGNGKPASLEGHGATNATYIIREDSAIEIRHMLISNPLWSLFKLQV